MRRAFSMVMAITVMVIMMGVSAMVFTLSNKIIFATGTQFQKEQAILLAKSYTEYAIMAVSANKGTLTGNNCLDNVNANITNIPIGNERNAPTDGLVDSGMGYRVSARISYIGNDTDGNLLNCTRVFNAAPVANDWRGLTPSPNIIVDVYVEYRDANMHLDGTSPMLTYHRRTIQKI